MRAAVAATGDARGMRQSARPRPSASQLQWQRDELAFFPVLYWPIVSGRPIPPAETLRKLEAYMKGGGLVIFDTRDAMSARPGGGTTIGAVAVARAPADGHTLLYATPNVQILNPHLMRSLPYDPVADFAPVIAVMRAPIFFTPLARSSHSSRRTVRPYSFT